MDPIPLRPSVDSPLQIQRREFLKGMGAGALALPAIAGPFVRAAKGATQQGAGAAGAVQQAAKNLDGVSPDGAIWPREFQNLRMFLRKGHITNWDYNPEYLEGDMFSLRTLDLWAEQEGQAREVSSALACLVVVYCFWIAYADIDGFRIDAAPFVIEDVHADERQFRREYSWLDELSATASWHRGDAILLAENCLKSRAPF